MLKMDVGIDLLWDVPGALIAPQGARGDLTTMHPFTGIQVTAKGVDHLASYVDVVRSVIGYDIALAADHFGHIALDSCIRIGRALEPFTLAWIEDLIPWQLTDQWRRLTAGSRWRCTWRRRRSRRWRACSWPPPRRTSSPSNTTQPTWNSGAPSSPACPPLIQNGHITVPDTPGLGFGDIDEELLRRHLDPCDPVFFAETTGCGAERAHQAGPCSARHRSYSGRASSDSG